MHTGAACKDDDECLGGLCLTKEFMASIGLDFDVPGGTCSGWTCQKNEECGYGGLCFDTTPFSDMPLSLCLPMCEDSEDCRISEGYQCYSFYPMVPDTNVCLPADLITTILCDDALCDDNEKSNPDICVDGCGCGDGTCDEWDNWETCFKDCLVWTDPSTGLVWQNPPMDSSTWQWEEAKAYCSDNEADLPGTGWHLPNISELRSLIRGCTNTHTVGLCGVTDMCPECGVDQSCLSWNPCHDNCNSCAGGGCFWPDVMEGNCSTYHSSSPIEGEDGLTFVIDFDNGSVISSYNDSHKVRCVR